MMMAELRKPEWLKGNKIGAEETVKMKSLLRKYNLHTVCESAQCPNRGECFENGTATFMILGNICTRNCTFCAVDKDKAKLFPPDPQEPKNIAFLCRELKLKYAVITTVTRDDLPDMGAGIFVETVKEIKEKCGERTRVEILVSDFQGRMELIEQTVNCGCDVFNHNIETVERLYPSVRPLASYERSLSLLREAKRINPKILTKSGFMLGLGESESAIVTLLTDLKQANVDIITIGQYMQPSKAHYPVREYVLPEVFAKYKELSLEMGFYYVEAGPLVRSSYHAERAGRQRHCG